MPSQIKSFEVYTCYLQLLRNNSKRRCEDMCSWDMTAAISGKMPLRNSARLPHRCDGGFEVACTTNSAVLLHSLLGLGACCLPLKWASALAEALPDAHPSACA
eukprot:GHUV01058430.1.p1 GENE.GHUV01058430.1~~GHUV01058430.1.p1  ORF type:complete len:103 (+),score=8.18 GHUV01058430.1:284-592(+)